MLDKYGRFIDDSRDYIIREALELVFKRDKEFARWVEQEEMLAAMWNAPSPALNLLVQHHPLDHSGMREERVLAQKSWAKCKQNQEFSFERAFPYLASRDDVFASLSSLIPKTRLLVGTR